MPVTRQGNIIRCQPALFQLFFGLFLAYSGQAWGHDIHVIFCDQCTDKNTNTRLHLSEEEERTASAYLSPDQMELILKIIKFEDGLNVQHLNKSLIVPKIIGVGSTSIGFIIPELESWLIRRLPGFYDSTSAIEHIFNINYYRKKLHRLEIATTETHLIALTTAGLYGVVYVIQPFLDASRLSKSLLKANGIALKQRLLKKQADVARKIIDYNKKHPDSAITVDIVNNNWEIHHLDNGDFEIRLNDLAQPLYKKDGAPVYDWYDQAFSVIAPFHLIVQQIMQDEFEELFKPRNLMMQALWGYETPIDASWWVKLNYQGAMKPLPREYPKWALKIVNSVLEESKLPRLTPEEVLDGYRSDKYAIACLHKYRHLTRKLRHRHELRRQLPSNIYMNPGNTEVEMYSTDQPPGYINCFLDAIKPW